VVKLVSALAAIVLATSTLAVAAPRHSAAGKTARAARSKSVKSAQPAKRSVSKARSQKTAVRKTTAIRKTPAIQKTTFPTTALDAEKREVKAAVIVPERPHDLKAEELEIKRLKTNVKAAEKAGDWRRAARDRRTMYQLEADLRADKADQQDQLRAARNVKKKSRIPFWGWWR
jgi:hypothetical protein